METNTKILFICNGSVNKGQMAESFYNKFSNSSDASSAIVSQTILDEFKILSPEVLQVMKEVKIEITSFKIKIVTEEMVKESDRIILFCEEKECPVFLLKHPSVSSWKIKNTDETSIENFRSTRDEIEILVYSKLMKVYY